MTTDTKEAPLSFTFVEFNERRAMRGAPAARVDVAYPDEPDGGGWLWMSRNDIKANMRDHGAHPELQKALDAYGAWK